MELNIYAPQIQHCITGRKSLKGLLLESEFKEISFTSRQCNCLYFLFFVTYLFSTTQSPQASPPPLSSGFRTALDIPLQLLSNLYNIPVLHPRHCHSSIWGCFGGFMGFPWIESTCSLSPNAKQCNWKSAPRTAPFETDNLRILVKPTSDELTENPASQLALGTNWAPPSSDPSSGSHCQWAKSLGRSQKNPNQKLTNRCCKVPSITAASTGNFHTFISAFEYFKVIRVLSCPTCLCNKLTNLKTVSASFAALLTAKTQLLLLYKT